MRAAGLIVVAVLALALTALGGATMPRGERPLPTVSTARPGGVPVLAYYYIWFDSSSWERPLLDFPNTERYSSDDADVMRRHIQQAKNAGISGFIVSWKGTEVLDRRLAQLVELARAESFPLAVIYEALDAQREPLPVEQVEADLTAFLQRYGTDPVFGLFSRPVVIWTGTWMFSRQDVARVVGAVRDGLTVLASEKDVEGYRRVADLVAGNAYYWSSVDPLRHPRYEAKLQAMGATVHGRGGLWVAPFAPGFDARRVGGTTVVERRNGETLRSSYSAAAGSSPDALGLISWNEFGESTHVEPSTGHGSRYLEVLRDLTGSAAPATGDRALDSNDSPTAAPGRSAGVLAFVVLGASMLVAVVVRRVRRAGGGS